VISLENLIGIPHYEITEIEQRGGEVRIWARYTGPRSCPHCGGTNLRNKGAVERSVRHVSWAAERVWLVLAGHRWWCRGCGKQFRERFPGVLKAQRATESFRFHIFRDHWDGINRSRVAAREHIGSATVERYCKHFLVRLAAERSGAPCPRILGLDEHFFTRKHGYATTFCDLKNHSIYDVVLGRSEAALESYFQRLPGKDQVRVVCMDLASVYRSLVRKYFPNARIVADRFHVIRLITHHFLACWRQLDPEGSKHRGLLSLMRRHRHHLSSEQSLRLAAYLQRYPVLDAIYRFKQRLCYLLLKKHRTKKQCAQLAPRLFRAIYQLRQAGLPQLVTLGDTLHSWAAEVGAMWRFTRNNGITEGFHTKMEVLQRQAYGFRNFNNYRLRVKVLCS
jgi:transposase